MENINKLEVIHIIPSPVGGGAEKLVRQLVAHLNNEEINTTGLYFTVKHASTGETLSLENNETSLNLNYVRHPKAIWLLRRYLKKQKENHGTNLIVHTHLTWAFFYVALANVGLGIPLIYTEHSSHNKRRNYRLWRPFDKSFYRAYQKIICISNGVEKALHTWLESDQQSKSEVIYNGVNGFLPARQLRCKNTRLKLLSVGSLNQRKGFNLALEALAGITEHVESYTLYGQGPEEEALKAQARQLGIDDKVIFAGWCDQLERAYQQADLLLIPSRWEGFGLIAVEAMSTGLPVLAADVDGLREVIADKSCLIPREVVLWQQKITEFALSGGYSHSSALIEQAKQFTLHKMTKAYSAVYQTIATPPK